MKRDWYTEKRHEALLHWQELAFGMFIHFGLYSLCGGVWDGKPVEVGYSEQILSHGPVPQADYEKLADSFTIENFNADALASLAIAAGMRYMVITAKHHDGFCLFDTVTTTYNTMHAACQRDVVGEISRACRKVGLRLGLYYSWIDWHFPYALPISPHNSDAIPPRHMEYTKAQLTELLTNYGDICELWMDMGAPTIEQSQEIRDLAHTLQPDIMVNGRLWNDCGDFLCMGDNQFPEYELALPWQMPATIYLETWGYRSWQERNNADGKIQSLSATLFSVLDRGGNYLLNIGPMGDGAVVPFEQEVLEGIGRKVRARGLVRCPTEELDVHEVHDDGLSYELVEARKYYRYTGGDYYSFHPIVTDLVWDVEVNRDAVYELSYRLPSPLERETKLCLVHPQGTILFSLKRHQKEGMVAGRLFLPAGFSRIRLHTVGSPAERPKLETPDIVLELKARKESHV